MSNETVNNSSQVEKLALAWLDDNCEAYDIDREFVDLVGVDSNLHTSLGSPVYFVTLTLPVDNMDFGFDLEDYFETLNTTVLVDIKPN